MSSKNQPPVFESASESYTSQGILGEGATSIVYRAADSDGKQWALKSLRPEQTTTGRVKRFLNELNFCRIDVHKNVIRVVDHGFSLQEGKKCPFYIMPCYSSTLQKTIQQGIAPPKVLAQFSQILDGVEAAHLKSVWRRDLKPANILLDPSTDTLVVSDFGVAQFIPEAMYTALETGPHERLANFQYAAPEQCVRGAAVDHRTDIYALGLILNEMFTGHVPRGSGFKKIEEVAPEFAYLDELVEHMRQQIPANRPNSIDEIKRTLIARKSDFISRQKLDQLKKIVVPSTTISHPLLENPPKLIDKDVRGNALVLILDQAVPTEWVKAFQGLTGVGYIRASAPRDWKFVQVDKFTEASVRLPPQDFQPETLQQIINNFKLFVERANSRFRQELESAARQHEDAQKRALQDRIASDNRRLRILSELKL